MKFKQIPLSALLLVAISLPLMPGSAGAQGRVKALKMLAPGTGWALKGGKLYWTSTDGATWTNITPPSPARFEKMSSVFFLDTSVGWVLFAGGGEEATFHLASTTDAGANWSVTPVTLPPPSHDSPTIIGQGQLAFSDPVHGWIDITAEGGAAFAPGRLATTTDGGRTWNWAPNDPLVRGSLSAVTPNEVWLAGGPDDGMLLVTFDGARSWQSINLVAPKEIAPATHATYDIPTFLDSRRGFEPVTFKGPGFRGSAVLFETADGGQTWQADRIVTNLLHLSGGQIVASGVADSTWVVRTSAGASNALKLGPGARAQSQDRVRYGLTGSPEVSFVSSGAGWIARPDGGLDGASSSPSDSLDTTPGGSVPETFAASPSAPASLSGQDTNQSRLLLSLSRSKAMLHAAHRQRIRASRAQDVKTTFPAIRSMDSGATSLEVSQHIGFHHCGVLDTDDYMNVWWDNSPYFDVGFYLPYGSALQSCDVTDLSSDWITTVSGQGWGLMPIWAGLQAPCYVQNPDNPIATFHWNPTDARTDGQNEALNALYVAASVGLTSGDPDDGYSPTIIYDDLERYTPSTMDSTNTYSCGDAAAAFVDGWVSTMMSELGTLHTGVYASPSNALDWTTRTTIISNFPENVWLTGTNDNVTVWNLYPTHQSIFPDTGQWSGTQRIHQYTSNDWTTWGDTDSIQIDNDIEDATILANSSVEKGYTFTTQNVSYPGALGTFPTGINNDINTDDGDYIGTITGTYRDTDYHLHGFLNFLDPTSSTSFDCATSGALTTEAEGLNDPTFSNEGRVVGFDDDTSLHAFWYDVASNTCSDISIPDAMYTFPMGINDSQWIAGYFWDSDENVHGFLMKDKSNPSSFIQIDVPSGNTTMATGVDGLGRVVGQYCNDYDCDNQPSFVYDSITSTYYYPLSYPGADSYTDAYGINNNGQFSGQDGDYEDSVDSLSFVGDLYDSDWWLPLDSLAPSLNSVAFGLNDITEIVGGNEYGSLPGVVAIPQH